MEENGVQDAPPAGFGDLPVELAKKIVVPLDAMSKRSLRLTNVTLKDIVDRSPINYHQVKMTLAAEMDKIEIEMLIDPENAVKLEFEQTTTGIVVRNRAEGWQKVEQSRVPRRRFLEKVTERFMKIFAKNTTSVTNLVFHFEPIDLLNTNFESIDAVYMFRDLIITLLKRSNRKLKVEHVQFLHYRTTYNFVRKLLPHIEPGNLKKITWLGHEEETNFTAIGTLEQFQRAEEFITDRVHGVEVFAKALHTRIVRERVMDTEVFIEDLVRELPSVRGQWRTINVEFEYRWSFDELLQTVDDHTPVELRGPNTKLLKIANSNDFVRIDVLQTNIVFTKVTGR